MAQPAVLSAPSITTLDLTGAWTLRDTTGGAALPAVVPGCVHTDLQRAGKLPPLFYRDNELQYLAACEQDWIFEREFTADAALLARDRVVLRCAGLDTLATVEVNGTVLIEADNMFRTWEADAKAALKVGSNRIRVTFVSPMPLMERLTNEVKRLPAWNIYHPRFAGKGWVRKMACSFGWDWGPMVPTAGIWKDISIIGQDRARLADVRVAQTHAAGAVQVAVNAEVAKFGVAAGALTVRAELSFAGATVASQSAAAGAPLSLAVSAPRLWWPNGLGEQNLYDLTVTLSDADGTVRDRWTRRIGLRTLTLLREADQFGESFAFVVNGLRIFAKGANWIPSDIFPSECGKEACKRNLRDAAEAGMNMIRAWGGGFYETDAFYDTCDDLGLLVWQDFTFACGTYPTFDPKFMANVRAEAIDNIRRLRHHASLAIWCGNNELEQGLVANDWNERSMSWADYAQLFDHLLPQLVAAEDGATPYWPCSPHSPFGDRHDFNNHRCGDAHAWSVWFGDQSFESQRTWKYRFQSEFGFQSFPEPRTVEAFTAPLDRNLGSYVMDLHQRSKSKGNGQIFRYLLDWFRVPKDFNSQLWMTQLTQALCIKYAAEHTRRMQPQTEGCVYWQINDMWPAATWSSIDCFGRWKALQHLAKQFFSPVLVTGLENAKSGTVEVHVSNHLATALNATAMWRATDCSGRELLHGSAPVSVPAQSNALAATVEFHGLRTRLGEQFVHGDAPSPTGALGMYRGDLDLLVWLTVEAEGRVLSQNLVLFARPKHLALQEPEIATTVVPAANGSYDVTLSAKNPALWTRLELDGADARFSDNWLHLDGSRAITVNCRPATALSLAEVQAKLRATSLIGNG